MSICEIMEDIRENVDKVMAVRQVYKVMSAKDIADEYTFEFRDTEREEQNHD